jgi:hypothetical protein
MDGGIDVQVPFDFAQTFDHSRQSDSTGSSVFFQPLQGFRGNSAAMIAD